MKNAIKLSSFVLIGSLFILPGTILAQQNGQQQNLENVPAHDGGTWVTEEGTQQINAQDGTGSTSPGGQAGQGLQDSTKSLNRVVTRTNNPETGEQIRTMVENHEQVQIKTATALKQMNNRSGIAKFILGPDYKNAGEIKGAISNLEGDLDALALLQEDASAADAEDIQLAIDGVETEIAGLETELTEQTSGFSLLGWLGKLISNY